MRAITSLLTDRVCSVYGVSQQSDYTIEWVGPKTLIVPERIDVLLKLYYIEARVCGLNMRDVTQIYSNHIHAITGFKDEENGQPDKNSIDTFLLSFDKLIDSFQKKGFDTDKSVIPVSNDNVILDGAHRLACCIYFKQPVAIVRIHHVGLKSKVKPPIYDYGYFEHYLLGRKELDLAVSQYINYSPTNLYIACLWPIISDLDSRKKVISLIKSKYKIVCCKTISPSFNLFDRLIAQVYMHDEWVGAIENNFSGSQGKSLMTFKNNSLLTFIVFEGYSTEETLALKDEIRNMFNIGKHSIHITDTNEQTAFLANIAFNENSLNLLEYADTGRYSKIIKDIYESDNGKLLNLEASKVVWGLADNHEDAKNYTYMSLKKGYCHKDLEHNPSCYFYYLGMKLVMPSEIIASEYFDEQILGPFWVQTKKIKLLPKINYFIKLKKVIIRNRVRVYLSRNPFFYKLLSSIKNKLY